MSSHEQLPVVVVACQVFQNLLEYMLPEGMADQITFLDYGLHIVPKKLTLTLQDVLDNIKMPSLVVLGYGLCGNGLKGIKAGLHTLLMPRTDDCIAMLLGSYQAYRREFKDNPGTYWLSKGWLESGTNPLAEYKKLLDQYDPEDADWIMNQQYQHYRRLALVAHTQADLDNYRVQAQEVARYCEQWGMRYEEVLGSDSYIRRLVEVAAVLDLAGEDFLIIPPGGEVRQEDFSRS